MTDERDPAGRPTQPRSGDYEGGEPVRDRDQGYGREPQQHQQRHGGGYGEQQEGGGGMHRGPRRSRYGRRRMPSDGMQEGGGGFQAEPRQQRQPEGLEDDVDGYLPSFIAGPMNGGGGGGQDHGSQQGGHQPTQAPQYNAGFNQTHQGAHGGQPQPQPQPSHQDHRPQHGHQGHQGHPNQQSHQGHQGGHAPMHHVEHQVHVPVPEEPSPEVQAAAAEFAQWEDKNPQLRGLLICSPTVKRAEPIVRGTRIPARILAAIAKMGSSVEEMLQDYPALTKEGLDAALAFTAAHPRRATVS